MFFSLGEPGGRWRKEQDDECPLVHVHDIILFIYVNRNEAVCRPHIWAGWRQFRVFRLPVRLSVSTVHYMPYLKRFSFLSIILVLTAIARMWEIFYLHFCFRWIKCTKEFFVWFNGELLDDVFHSHSRLGQDDGGKMTDSLSCPCTSPSCPIMLVSVRHDLHLLCLLIF